MTLSASNGMGQSTSTRTTLGHSASNKQAARWASRRRNLRLGSRQLTPARMNPFLENFDQRSSVHEISVERSAYRFEGRVHPAVNI